MVIDHGRSEVQGIPPSIRGNDLNDLNDLKDQGFHREVNERGIDPKNAEAEHSLDSAPRFGGLDDSWDLEPPTLVRHRPA